MKKIHEVRNGFTDDDNYTHIDVYHSSDESVPGTTVAIVCNDTKKVFFIDNMYRSQQAVKEAIDDVLSNPAPMNRNNSKRKLIITLELYVTSDSGNDNLILANEIDANISSCDLLSKSGVIKAGKVIMYHSGIL